MKIYIIDKLYSIIHVFDNSKDASLWLWGRSCSQNIVIVSNKNGEFLLPLEMTKGDVKSIQMIIDSIENV
jgi:hypothetical protein